MRKRTTKPNDTEARTNADLGEIQQKLRSAMETLDQRCEPDVERCRAVALQVAHSVPLPDLVNILCDCVTYYEQIGNRQAAFDTASEALEFAMRSTDLAAARRAHNALGMQYFRHYNLRAAKLHLERSFAAACELKQKAAGLAALANMCAMLMEMGSYPDAIDLALKITQIPGEPGIVDRFLLQNATNALKMCLRITDVDLARYFFTIACEKETTSDTPDAGMTKAYSQSNRVAFLVMIGEEDAAKEALTVMYERWAEVSNGRIRLLVEISRGLYESISKNRESIVRAIDRLERMLPLSAVYPVHREDVLRALIQLHARLAEVGGAVGDAEVGYLRLLREHWITCNHWQHFKPRGDETVNNAGQLDYPVYSVPQWSGALASFHKHSSNNERIVVASRSHFDSVAAELRERAFSFEERELRTAPPSVWPRHGPLLSNKHVVLPVNDVLMWVGLRPSSH